jgi:hypothetical protein
MILVGVFRAFGYGTKIGDRGKNALISATLEQPIFLRRRDGSSKADAFPGFDGRMIPNMFFAR